MLTKLWIVDFFSVKKNAFSCSVLFFIDFLHRKAVLQALILV